MTISEIENMDAATLKASKAAAVEAVKGAPELATRYVQARLDATIRDEKLAEQGKTISALHDAAEASKTREAELETQIQEARAELERESQRASAKAVGIDQKLTEALDRYVKLNAQFTDVSARVAKAEALAKSRRTALADVAALINPKLAEE